MLDRLSGAATPFTSSFQVRSSQVLSSCCGAISSTGGERDETARILIMPGTRQRGARQRCSRGDGIGDGCELLPPGSCSGLSDACGHAGRAVPSRRGHRHARKAARRAAQGAPGPTGHHRQSRWGRQQHWKLGCRAVGSRRLHVVDQHRHDGGASAALCQANL